MRISNTQIGRFSTIERNCTFSGFKEAKMKRLDIGNCSFIGEGYRICASEVQIGDYVKLHNHGLILGPSSCVIGHNCWVGERTVLNCHAPLKIGNNVQIGMENHVWTHVMAGELFEGSTLHNMRPVTIESDVWLVGNGIVICPGITLARGTVVLPNSVVTKSTEPFHCYAGNPVLDITSKVRPWRYVSPQTKFRMMRGFVQEFLARNKKARITIDSKNHVIRLVGGGKETVFDIKSKTYTRTLSKPERDFMLFLVGVKARFIPVEA